MLQKFGSTRDAQNILQLTPTVAYIQNEGQRGFNPPSLSKECDT